jgi:hypothetical protein
MTDSLYSYLDTYFVILWFFSQLLLIPFLSSRLGVRDTTIMMVSVQRNIRHVILSCFAKAYFIDCEEFGLVSSPMEKFDFKNEKISSNFRRSDFAIFKAPR